MMAPEVEQEELDPQLMVLRDAIELRLSAAGILNSEIEGTMINHPKEGAWAALTIRVGAPYPPLVRLVELEEEVLGLFAGGKVEVILSENAELASNS